MNGLMTEAFDADLYLENLEEEIYESEIYEVMDDDSDYLDKTVFDNIAAIHPELVRNSRELQRESMFLLFIGTTIYFVIASTFSVNRLKYYCSIMAYSLTGALASATRFEGWEMFPFILMWQLGLCISKKRGIFFLYSSALFIFSWALFFLFILIICNCPLSVYFHSIIEQSSRMR